MNKEKFTEYKGKNVYITGITGFKGSWLALMLHHLGANVHGFGLPEFNNQSIYHTARIEEVANVTLGDITSITSRNKLISSVLDCNPDYIFHMAAQPLVSEGYNDPYTTFNTNIMGTVAMHEILRGLLSPARKDDLERGSCFRHEDSYLSCKKVSFINVTTDKVYKESNKPLNEDDELKGFDPYSLSKSCSDMISQSYRDSMNSNHLISTMRAGNVIGGGDMSDNRIIPDIVRAVTEGKELSLRNPNSVRPYQHVFDALTSYLYIALLQKENEELQGEYNVGPELEQTMTTQELVEKMSEELKFTWNTSGESIGKESDYLALNNSKIKEKGWKPAFGDNEKVVKATASWYSKFIDGEDMQEYTLKQISEAFNSL